MKRQKKAYIWISGGIRLEVSRGELARIIRIRRQSTLGRKSEMLSFQERRKFL